ncbi:hypothetical protein RQM65_17395 [Pricia sp. S334]|uniref:DUF3649 domain-containing protein n=1 Tax=Pricia mediterranea TaxID=3076079 RepID=A0ABU3LAC9_9FLAO|nr:hypothetical protein [Pricia sp. S334]MDT7830447.1 hypothetical protein [Pricia sp. S334]
MPANKKYLTQSPALRFAKISAGFVGGYMVTQALHMLLIKWWSTASAIITLQFAGFALWAILMILAFLSKNVWITWGVYLLVTAGMLGILYIIGAI